MTTRREFIVKVGLGSAAALIATRQSLAADMPMLSESDPQAATLGYKTDAAKADKVKYPKWAAGQQCGNCQLYQGKPGSTQGPCPLYAGKQVLATGWCSAYAKKPA
jgi:hypothetical protein